MNSTEALERTDVVVSQLIAGLDADQRDNPTPCDEWTLHDLIGHMCGGGHMVAGALQGEASTESAPDFLADGPAAGWSATVEHLRGAATPDALTSSHRLPFGEMPGEVALAVIVADHLVHGWDVAQASGQAAEIDDELAAWALTTWEQVLPAEGRTGPGFKEAVQVADDASAVDRLVAFTGRRP